MILIEGLEEIASDYGGMLIDQFGVLHDGTRLYSGSLDVLARLRALKIPIAVMTNSGKRTEANIARLTKMGIPREFYVDAVSSDRKSTRLNSSHRCISYAVFCLKKKNNKIKQKYTKPNHYV